MHSLLREGYGLWRRTIPNLSMRFRQPYTYLYYIDEGKDWVIKWLGQSILHRLHQQVGLEGQVTPVSEGIERQLIHFGSRNVYFTGGYRRVHASNRVVVTWFHGSAGDPNPENQQMISRLPERVPHVHRLVTASSTIRDRLLTWGVPAAKLAVIPLGVDLRQFRPPAPEERRWRRTQLGIPDGTLCIGSFQKDGHGWGEGMEPKLIKGPDLFLEVVRKLARRYRVYVLLTGPARGFVKRGLEALGVPYRHDYLSDHAQIVPYYHCLDLYLVTSRDEGGPLSVLESMATGVPVVSSRVGMAADLLINGENGYLVDVEDVEGLTEAAARLLEGPALRQRCVEHGLETITGYDWPLVARQYYERVYRYLFS